MQAFKYRQLGKTSLKLPSLGYGTVGISNFWTSINKNKDCVDTMDASWDQGVRYYDSAPFYGTGMAEHRMGSFLREKEEGSYIVSTKVGRVLRPHHGDMSTIERGACTGGMPFTFKFDYTYDGIMRSYEDSTQRTSLRFIDMLIIHDTDLFTHGKELRDQYLKELESGFKALEKLKADGLIKAIGLGVNEGDSMKKVMYNFPLDFLMVAQMYSMLDQSMIDDELKFIEKNQIGMVCAAPYASGILATGAIPGAKYNYKEASPELLETTRKIEEVCKTYNVPLKAAALQFTLGHPLMASTIPGPMWAKEAIDNANMVRTKIPDEFWTTLKEKRLIDPRSPLEGLKDILA